VGCVLVNVETIFQPLIPGGDNAFSVSVIVVKEYHGVAFVVDARYATAYHPVMDANGK
jgi:hypothetical protein